MISIFKKFYNATDLFTDKEIAFRDNFWKSKIPSKHIPSPNVLTVVRIIGSICLFFYQPQTFYFFLVVIVLFLTDYFDGIIARTQDKITNFGIWADPIADRLLLGSVIYFLYLQNPDFWTPNLVRILIPELIILVLGLALYLQGSSVIPNPNAWGRLKCFCYFIAMILFLFNNPTLAIILINVGIGFSAFSILGYSSRLRFGFAK